MFKGLPKMTDRSKMAFIGFFIFEKVLVREIFLNPIDPKLRGDLPSRCLKNMKILAGTLEYLFLQVI